MNHLAMNLMRNYAAFKCCAGCSFAFLCVCGISGSNEFTHYSNSILDERTRITEGHKKMKGMYGEAKKKRERERKGKCSTLGTCSEKRK